MTSPSYQTWVSFINRLLRTVPGDQEFIDCTVELKACILILGGNQLWRNDPFQDKSESWTSGNDDRWNLEEETTDEEHA